MIWLSKKAKQKNRQNEACRESVKADREEALRKHKQALEKLRSLTQGYVDRAVDDVAGEFK